MDNSLKIYVKQTCPFCNKLLRLLDASKIKYQSFVIDKNPEVKKEIITRGDHTPTPQVEYNGAIIFDYTTEEDLVEEIKRLMAN